VVVADKTGGERPQIWSRGIAKINLMQPALVISVGDLIQGYTQQKSVVLYFCCLRVSDRNTKLIMIHE